MEEETFRHGEPLKCDLVVPSEQVLTTGGAVLSACSADNVFTSDETDSHTGINSLFTPACHRGRPVGCSDNAQESGCENTIYNNLPDSEKCVSNGRVARHSSLNIADRTLFIPGCSKAATENEHFGCTSEQHRNLDRDTLSTVTENNTSHNRNILEIPPSTDNRNSRLLEPVNHRNVGATTALKHETSGVCAALEHVNSAEKMTMHNNDSILETAAHRPINNSQPSSQNFPSVTHAVPQRVQAADKDSGLVMVSQNDSVTHTKSCNEKLQIESTLHDCNLQTNVQFRVQDTHTTQKPCDSEIVSVSGSSDLVTQTVSHQSVQSEDEAKVGNLDSQRVNSDIPFSVQSKDSEHCASLDDCCVDNTISHSTNNFRKYLAHSSSTGQIDTCRKSSNLDVTTGANITIQTNSSNCESLVMAPGNLLERSSAPLRESRLSGGTQVEMTTAHATFVSNRVGIPVLADDSSFRIGSVVHGSDVHAELKYTDLENETIARLSSSDVQTQLKHITESELLAEDHSFDTQTAVEDTDIGNETAQKIDPKLGGTIINSDATFSSNVKLSSLKSQSVVNSAGLEMKFNSQDSNSGATTSVKYANMGCETVLINNCSEAAVTDIDGGAEICGQYETVLINNCSEAAVTDIDGGADICAQESDMAVTNRDITNAETEIGSSILENVSAVKSDGQEIQSNLLEGNHKFKTSVQTQISRTLEFTKEADSTKADGVGKGGTSGDNSVVEQYNESKTYLITDNICNRNGLGNDNSGMDITMPNIISEDQGLLQIMNAETLGRCGNDVSRIQPVPQSKDINIHTDENVSIVGNYDVMGNDINFKSVGDVELDLNKPIGNDETDTNFVDSLSDEQIDAILEQTPVIHQTDTKVGISVSDGETDKEIVSMGNGKIFEESSFVGDEKSDTNASASLSGEVGINDDTSNSIERYKNNLGTSLDYERIDISLGNESNVTNLGTSIQNEKSGINLSISVDNETSDTNLSTVGCQRNYTNLTTTMGNEEIDTNFSIYMSNDKNDTNLTTTVINEKNDTNLTTTVINEKNDTNLTTTVINEKNDTNLTTTVINEKNDTNLTTTVINEKNDTNLTTTVSNEKNDTDLTTTVINEKNDTDLTTNVSNEKNGNLTTTVINEKNDTNLTTTVINEKNDTDLTTNVSNEKNGNLTTTVINEKNDTNLTTTVINEKNDSNLTTTVSNEKNDSNLTTTVSNEKNDSNLTTTVSNMENDTNFSIYVSDGDDTNFSIFVSDDDGTSVDVITVSDGDEDTHEAPEVMARKLPRLKVVLQRCDAGQPSLDNLAPEIVSSDSNCSSETPQNRKRSSDGSLVSDCSKAKLYKSKDAENEPEGKSVKRASYKSQRLDDYECTWVGKPLTGSNTARKKTTVYKQKASVYNKKTVNDKKTSVSDKKTSVKKKASVDDKKTSVDDKKTSVYKNKTSVYKQQSKHAYFKRKKKKKPKRYFNLRSLDGTRNLRPKAGMLSDSDRANESCDTLVQKKKNLRHKRPPESPPLNPTLPFLEVDLDSVEDESQFSFQPIKPAAENNQIQPQEKKKRGPKPKNYKKTVSGSDSSSSTLRHRQPPESPPLNPTLPFLEVDFDSVEDENQFSFQPVKPTVENSQLQPQEKKKRGPKPKNYKKIASGSDSSGSTLRHKQPPESSPLNPTLSFLEVDMDSVEDESQFSFQPIKPVLENNQQLPQEKKKRGRKPKHYKKVTSGSTSSVSTGSHFVRDTVCDPRHRCCLKTLMTTSEMATQWEDPSKWYAALEALTAKAMASHIKHEQSDGTDNPSTPKMPNLQEVKCEQLNNQYLPTYPCQNTSQDIKTDVCAPLAPVCAAPGATSSVQGERVPGNVWDIPVRQQHVKDEMVTGHAWDIPVRQQGEMVPRDAWDIPVRQQGEMVPGDSLDTPVSQQRVQDEMVPGHVWDIPVSHQHMQDEMVPGNSWDIPVSHQHVQDEVVPGNSWDIPVSQQRVQDEMVPGNSWDIPVSQQCVQDEMVPGNSWDIPVSHQHVQNEMVPGNSWDIPVSHQRVQDEMVPGNSWDIPVSQQRVQDEMVPGNSWDIPVSQQRVQGQILPADAWYITVNQQHVQSSSTAPVFRISQHQTSQGLNNNLDPQCDPQPDTHSDRLNNNNHLKSKKKKKKNSDFPKSSPSSTKDSHKTASQPNSDGKRKKSKITSPTKSRKRRKVRPQNDCSVIVIDDEATDSASDLDVVCIE